MRLPSLLLSCRLLIVILVCVYGIGGAHAVAGAGQEASPDASPAVNFPITPGAVECSVEPRASDELIALLGTPVAHGEQATELSSVPVPVGRPAEGSVVAGVTATVREFHACFNANDSLRAFAMVSDAFLQGYVERNSLTSESITMLLIPASEPVLVEAQTTILAVTDIAELADGRAGAFVVTTSEWRGPTTSYMVFAREGEHWLLDEVIAFL